MRAASERVRSRTALYLDARVDIVPFLAGDEGKRRARKDTSDRDDDSRSNLLYELKIYRQTRQPTFAVADGRVMDVRH